MNATEMPDALYLFVEWSSIEAHKKWRQTDRRTQFLDEIAEFKERPNEFCHFDVFVDR